MGGLNILRGIVGGVDQAAGNTQGAAQMQAANDQANQQRLQQQKLLIAPLSQQLSADRLRLAAYVDPKTMQPLAGHEDDYSNTLNRMADTIGQIRTHMGNGAPANDPSGLKLAAAKLLDRTHITNDLQGHLMTGQTDKANAYANQNLQSAAALGNGAVPPPSQSGPDAWQKFSANYKEATGSEPPPEVAQQFARKQGGLSEQEKVSPVKPAAPLEAGGVMYGVRGSDGKEYLASDLDKPTTPPEVKELYKTIKDAQTAKQTEAQKKEQEINDRAARAQAAIESRFERSQVNQGTWQVTEDADGKPQLFNSKTGQLKDAPGGMHKSGYYAKQVAPLEAASSNIKDYVDNGVYTGAGDLDLQHQYFTATQPATGFRMTKVQQDILADSQSWMNSLEAKARHAATGTWFSDEQRKQIADEAQKAIAAKKKALNVAGPQTEQLRNIQSGSGNNYVTQSFQGRNVPGLVEKGNLDITQRPNIDNGDGTHSSTFSMSFGTDKGEVLVPGVGDGITYPLRKLTPKEALDQYKKTGKNFGTFKDGKTADRYAQKLHEDQAKFGNNPKVGAGNPSDDEIIKALSGGK